MNKNKKEVVVVLSHLPWDFPCDYVKQTSLELTKRAKVILLSPLDFPTFRQVIFERKKISFSQKGGIVIFPTIGMIPFQRLDVIKKLNIRLNLFLFRLFYLLKFGQQRPIFWAFSYRLAEIKNWFGWAKILVYDRVDQVASLDLKEDKVMKQKDQQLLRVADYVFTNSPYALKYIKQDNKKSFLVPCGSATDLFLERKTKQSREMKKIKRPILGLIGSIDHRLDFKILYPLAKKRKDWSFAFIGSAFSQETAQFQITGLDQWLNKLKKLPNIFFLGQKPKEKLADFIASFDACLIPYDISQEFVKGCNPMKLYEFLGMGKPVVSTPIAAVKQYSPTVQIASSAAGFEKAIEKLLKEGRDKGREEKRKKIALENSWEEKVKKMWQIAIG
jgi:hypothetical protein